MSALRLIYTTWPDADSARAAARTLVEEKTIACANLIPGMESVYCWQGVVETAAEVILLLKTTDERVSETMRRVAELHPYSVPSIVELNVGSVAPLYLGWAVEAVRRD